MNIQYLSDNLGNKTAVLIPITDWEKITKKYNNLTLDNDNNPEKQMSQDEFVQWIDDAEKSPTMSLETFNGKWNQEIQKIKSLTH